MKKSVFVAVFALLCCAGSVFAGTVGPVKSAVTTGGISLGIGYANVNVEWDKEGTSFPQTPEMASHQVFTQLGFGTGHNWSATLRGGAALIGVDDAYLVGGDLEADDAMPFVTLGLQGTVFDGEVLKVGPYVQGSYFFTAVEDDVTKTATKETIAYRDMWDAKVGCNFQVELEGAQLYAGPMYYISEVEVKNSQAGVGSSVATLEEKDHFGFMAGIQWKLKRNLALELEVEQRSAVGVGLTLNKSF